MSERDSTHREVVRAQFDLNSVSGHDSDVVHPHLSADVRENFHIALVELYAKASVRQVLDDRAVKLNPLFLIGLIVGFGFIVPSARHE